MDCTDRAVAVSVIDVTTSGGRADRDSLANLTSGLDAGAPLKAYGIPQADGTLEAYVPTRFTGQAPVQ